MLWRCASRSTSHHPPQLAGPRCVAGRTNLLSPALGRALSAVHYLSYCVASRSSSSSCESLSSIGSNAAIRSTRSSASEPRPAARGWLAALTDRGLAKSKKRLKESKSAVRGRPGWREAPLLPASVPRPLCWRAATSWSLSSSKELRTVRGATARATLDSIYRRARHRQERAAQRGRGAGSLPRLACDQRDSDARFHRTTRQRLPASCTRLDKPGGRKTAPHQHSGNVESRRRWLGRRRPAPTSTLTAFPGPLQVARRGRPRAAPLRL
jgi:hypothetical protein